MPRRQLRHPPPQNVRHEARILSLILWLERSSNLTSERCWRPILRCSGAVYSPQWDILRSGRCSLLQQNESVIPAFNGLGPSHPNRRPPKVSSPLQNGMWVIDSASNGSGARKYRLWFPYALDKRERSLAGVSLDSEHIGAIVVHRKNRATEGAIQHRSTAKPMALPPPRQRAAMPLCTSRRIIS